MSKGRILVAFGNIPLYGQELQNIEVLTGLMRSGWDILVVTNDRWGHLDIEPELTSRAIPWTSARFASRFDRGMGMRAWAERLGDLARGSWQFAMIWRRFQPTHVHLFNPQWFIDFLPVFAVTRAPAVYRLGDVPAQHGFLFRWLWSSLLGRRVAVFVCISGFVERALLEAVPRARRIERVTDRPASRPRIVDEQVPRRDDGLVTFAYVGQISEEKGILLLVEAALRMTTESNRVRFLLAGDASSTFAGGLQRQVASAGCEERIAFLGYIHDTPGLLRIADVHVYPSLWPEALGSAVLEAKAAGVPSIVFPSGGLPELITHGEDGYICSDKTINGLAEALRFYVDSPTERRRQGDAARESLARLGVYRTNERWDAIYDSLSRD